MKVKDEIIQNINAKFNLKVSDLNKNVEALEAYKNKTEKKALKKLRQKARKEAEENTIEHASIDVGDKDENENCRVSGRKNMLSSK